MKKEAKLKNSSYTTLQFNGVLTLKLASCVFTPVVHHAPWKMLKIFEIYTIYITGIGGVKALHVFD